MPRGIPKAGKRKTKKAAKAAASNEAQKKLAEADQHRINLYLCVDLLKPVVDPYSTSAAESPVSKRIMALMIQSLDGLLEKPVEDTVPGQAAAASEPSSEGPPLL